MVGDTLETNLEFRTGFDGKTKMSLGFYSLRLWCANGAKNWKKDVDLSMKNTLKNQAKLMYFSNELLTATNMIDSQVAFLNKAVNVQVNQATIDKFLTELTGYDVKEYKELNTRKRNILDSINGNIAIEMSNTGNNLLLIDSFIKDSKIDLIKLEL
jgi:hypothetical protein